MEKRLTINNIEVSSTNEKNLLEVIKKHNIYLPTLCYEPELKAFGSCGLCVVEVEGRGFQPACLTAVENGMKIKTDTEQLNEMRKTIIELLLSKHDYNCLVCSKSGTCKLQNLAKKFDVDTSRFKNVLKKTLKDISSPSLVRDMNKCILCGNCVRYCEEMQGIGAVEFSNHGNNPKICQSLGKDFSSSKCVNCGQCARVCPTGAITIKSQINEVWKEINNPNKKVVVSIAPAVRATIGEVFKMEGADGSQIAGKIVTALKLIGIDKVFDLSCLADMTILEEACEFLERISTGVSLPMFSSCCSAWVKFVEDNYPQMTKNLSSCRSPQGMFGSVSKRIMPCILNIDKKDLVVVSIVPCTAKKYEAKRPELSKDGIPDVDYVLTTQELARMMEEAKINFKDLKESEFDAPMGCKTGGGIIFGNSGGVTESMLRNIIKLKEGVDETKAFEFVRGENGIREAKVNIGGRELKFAIVHGLKNTKIVLEELKKNKSKYDFVEVMACPNGCIGGAGQPVCCDLSVKKIRAKVLYDNDKSSKFHKPQDNPDLQKMYKEIFEKPGSTIAYELLHTIYRTDKFECEK